MSRPVAAAAQKSESEVGKGAKGPRKQPWRPVVVPGTTVHGAAGTRALVHLEETLGTIFQLRGAPALILQLRDARAIIFQLRDAPGTMLQL